MKPLNWVGSSLNDLREFPPEVRREAGQSIYFAQKGGKAVNAVPMLGFGSAKILEVVINNDGNTYRAVYTVKFQKAVYVLHAFQKKSHKGIATPKPDLSLIKQRLSAAEKHYKENFENPRRGEHIRGQKA